MASKRKSKAQQFSSKKLLSFDACPLWARACTNIYEKRHQRYIRKVKGQHRGTRQSRKTKSSYRPPPLESKHIHGKHATPTALQIYWKPITSPKGSHRHKQLQCVETLVSLSAESSVGGLENTSTTCGLDTQLPHSSRRWQWSRMPNKMIGTRTLPQNNILLSVPTLHM